MYNFITIKFTKNTNQFSTIHLLLGGPQNVDDIGHSLADEIYLFCKITNKKRNKVKQEVKL